MVDWFVFFDVRVISSVWNLIRLYATSVQSTLIPLPALHCASRFALQLVYEKQICIQSLCPPLFSGSSLQIEADVAAAMSSFKTLCP